MTNFSTANNLREKLLGIRHLESFLMFICISLSYFIRVNTSVAVVAMTDKMTTNPDFEEFDWNNDERNYILSSFFWGYVITQLPSGWLAQKYGVKFLLLAGVAIPSCFSIITPIAVHYGGWLTYCGIRVVQGMFQGVLFPCLHAFFAKWAPFNERNQLVSFSNSGMEFGTILAFCASGFIAASPLGWPGVSYITGGLGIIWTVLWVCFGANSPAESKIISTTEKELIETSLAGRVSNTQMKNFPTPWKNILTSMPFWALLIARTSQSWGFTFLLTQIPTYMNKILKLDIKSNAIFSAIPYALMLTVSYCFIIIANLLSKRNVKLSVIRKTLNTIAFWIPAITILGLGFVTNDNLTLAVTLLAITVASNGTQSLGSILNHIDLSPNYAGVLMGITNTTSSIISICLPIIQSQIVQNDKDQSQWRIMFGITSAVFFVGNLIYIIFGKMDPQAWNEPQAIDEKDSQNQNKSA